MDISMLFKIAAYVLLTVIVASLLGEIKKEYRAFPFIALAIYILSISIQSFANIYEKLLGILPDDFSVVGFNNLLKVVGICLITDLMADIAKDNGSQTVSNAVSLFGRISMLACILPLVSEIVAFVK